MCIRDSLSTILELVALAFVALLLLFALLLLLRPPALRDGLQNCDVGREHVGSVERELVRLRVARIFGRSLASVGNEFGQYLLVANEFNQFWRGCPAHADAALFFLQQILDRARLLLVEHLVDLASRGVCHLVSKTKMELQGSRQQKSIYS